MRTALDERSETASEFFTSEQQRRTAHYHQRDALIYARVPLGTRTLVFAVITSSNESLIGRQLENTSREREMQFTSGK